MFSRLVTKWQDQEHLEFQKDENSPRAEPMKWPCEMASVSILIVDERGQSAAMAEACDSGETRKNTACPPKLIREGFANLLARTTLRLSILETTILVALLRSSHAP